MTNDSKNDLTLDEYLAVDRSKVHRNGDLGKWWGQGARSAALQRVDWTGLRVTPGIMACLVIAPLLVVIGAARLYFVGNVEFFSPAILFGWLGTVVAAWVSWLLVPDHRAPELPGPPTAMHLFGMFLAQGLIVTLVGGLMSLIVARGMPIAPPELHRQVFNASIGMWWAWHAVAQLGLIRRVAATNTAPRWIASIVMLASLAANAVTDRPPYWYVAQPQVAQAPAQEPFQLTQELIELQPLLLREKLAAIKAGPAGATNLYAITFSPYAAEDVFRRESAMVADVIGKRFDAGAHVIELVNHRDTVGDFGWATPRNLERAIAHMASVMDRDEDILFLHLTSHGASNGMLAASFEPMAIAPVVPADLKTWLDRAGIRHRVISISACYAGKWIDDLAGIDTLVMTASDATHTSYGCGRGSALTFFGRAMYDEAIRTDTLSFEAAHAAARGVILQRETQAGKTDGYSNPQIRVGAAIRARLALLQASLR